MDLEVCLTGWAEQRISSFLFYFFLVDITSVLEIQRSVTLSPNVLISDWVHLSKYKDLNLLEMQMLEI